MSGAGGRSNGYDDPRRWSKVKGKAKEDFGRSQRVIEKIYAGGLVGAVCQQQSSSLPRSSARWPINLALWIRLSDSEKMGRLLPLTRPCSAWRYNSNDPCLKPRAV